VEDAKPAEEGPDPSTLPPVTAPASHPKIDPTVTGTIEGRSVYEVDLSNMADKPWRRPGSDISDWFNYGFDEISWEAYCYRRRELGDLATVLKTNVIVKNVSPFG
jgi:pre-mRNA 3'-end-processing factor FIP1